MTLCTARTRQWEKAPDWVGGAGKGAPNGHVVNKALEAWFEGEEAVQEHYKNLTKGGLSVIEAMGYKLDELGPEWYPEE